MIKTFPKSRICVIDIYPSFEKGLKQALDFTNKHNIRLSSADGKRIILSFCLSNIQNTYNTTTSAFPKVTCMSKKAITKKISSFVDQHFDGMMEQLPIPYCGKFDLNNPDLESAAENSLKKTKSQRKFVNLVSKLKIRNVN